MGVRTQIASAQDDFQIYDVVSDPGQKINLATSLPELQAELKVLAVSGRRPGAGVVRPYDSAAVPASVAPPDLRNGVRWKRYAGPFPWVPEFRDLVPTAIGSDTTFDPAKHAPSSNSGLFYKGFIQVPIAGDYTFFLTSDAGASLHMHRVGGRVPCLPPLLQAGRRGTRARREVVGAQPQQANHPREQPVL